DVFTGPPIAVAAKYTAAVSAPLPLTTWVTDEGPKINVPENAGRGRGRGRGTARGGDAAADAGAAGAAAEPPAGRGGDQAAQGRGRGRGAGAARGAGGEFTPPPRIAITWTKFRGPGDVKFDA